MKTHAISQALALAILISGCSAFGVFSLGSSAATQGTDTPGEGSPRPPSSEHGRRLFVQSCAHCHGDDARGNGEDGDGPNLYRLPISNARIAAVIRTGIPEEMPSFAKKHGTVDIADLTAFLRTLR
jgi:mono/diheme cytochrome c family protein